MTQTLGTRLRELREQSDLNQVEVAVAVGASRSAISKIETDDYKPGRDILLALATFYSVSLDWLISGKGDKAIPKATAETSEEAMLLFAYRHLPTTEAEPLLRMLMSRVNNTAE